jgi:hypothetical protein
VAARFHHLIGAGCGWLSMMDDIDRRKKRLHIIASIVASEVAAELPAKKFLGEGHSHNRLDADYNSVVNKINDSRKIKGCCLPVCTD